jgi:hypothetical protein
MLAVNDVAFESHDEIDRQLPFMVLRIDITRLVQNAALADLHSLDNRSSATAAIVS